MLGWAPGGEKIELASRAKREARKATCQGAAPHTRCHQVSTTVRNTIVARQRQGRRIPPKVEKYSKQVDAALPGKHTLTLYDNLKRDEARVLAQLRTGMARLNGYLHQIGKAETYECACGQTRETIKHFLFYCAQWETQRRNRMQQRESKRGNLSFFLGGREPTDQDDWKPDMKAVRATIKFALETKRLDYVPETDDRNIH